MHIAVNYWLFTPLSWSRGLFTAAGLLQSTAALQPDSSFFMLYKCVSARIIGDVQGGCKPPWSTNAHTRLLHYSPYVHIIVHLCPCHGKTTSTHWEGNWLHNYVPCSSCMHKLRFVKELHLLFYGTCSCAQVHMLLYQFFKSEMLFVLFAKYRNLYIPVFAK